MSAAVRIAVRQGSDAWLVERRGLITATDLPVLLGVSPWRSEADLAAEKTGTAPAVEPSLRMRMGNALEPLIAAAYTEATGRRLRRFHGLLRHPTIEWAAASPDYGVVGERRLVEAKFTGSRTRFADGLPVDVEAQAQWQLMVTGYPTADVAALVGDELRVFAVEADAAMAAGLVDIAADFRRRLRAGGPFAHNAESVKAAYPADNGAEMRADADLDVAVRTLLATRAQRRRLAETEEALETHVKERMGEVAYLVGDGWRVSWKRSRERVETDWHALADSLMGDMAETERAALVGRHGTVREGARYFRVTVAKEDEG